MGAVTELKVCVLGLGYIGLPTSAVIARTGAQVLGIDVTASVVDTVNSGRIHIEEVDLDGLVSGVVARGTHRPQRALERSGQHHHSRSAAVRSVVDAAVGVVGVVAQRPEFDPHLPALVGAPGDAVRQMRREQLGEQRDDVETHRRSGVSNPGPSRP